MTTHEPPAEAVEVAARAMADDWNPDRDPILTAMFRDYAMSALTAAGPIIEQAVAEQIEAVMADPALIERADRDQGYYQGQVSGLALAARIARGGRGRDGRAPL